MTKEEIDIQKEIEKYFTESTGFGKDKIRNFMDIVNKALKQKGERIEELENKIADIKANCDLAIEGRDVKIKELELELTVEKDLHQEETNLHLHAEEYTKSLEQKLEQTEKDLTDYQFNYPKIKELEKENAGLKARLNAINLLTPELEKRSKLKNQQLTKAKELFERFLGLGNLWDLGCKDYFPLRKEVEQFLKEIKK